MKILHILNDGPTDLSTRIIDIQSRDNEVKIIDLSSKDIQYEVIVDEIFSHDRVISW
jgi:hypothetical protein